MDNLFRTRVLTAAVNNIKTPETRIYDKFFRGKENMQMTDRLAFDIITGNEGILGNISVYEQATMTARLDARQLLCKLPVLLKKEKYWMRSLTQCGNMETSLLRNK
jgi:hypothetical protein